MVKFSGKHRRFESGAHRDGATGKGRYDLIPHIVEPRVAAHYEGGAIHHGDRNWEKGIPDSVLVDSLKRHLNKVMRGVRDEDHHAAIIWNAEALAFNDEMIRLGLLPESLHDIPTYTGGKNGKRRSKSVSHRVRRGR